MPNGIMGFVARRREARPGMDERAPAATLARREVADARGA
jgi:hypothetical protein